MRAGVITFPGSNCDRDVAVALAACGARVERALAQATELPALDLIVLPGGFTYGDYLRCGAIAAHSPVMREVVRARPRAWRVLGICNGFQILTEAGLLPGALLQQRRPAFLPSVAARGGDRRVRVHRGLRSAARCSVLPIAHGDGNYFCADERRCSGWRTRTAWRSRYCGESERLDRRHRRCARVLAQRARHDAAPRGAGRSADGRHRRPGRCSRALIAALS